VAARTARTPENINEIRESLVRDGKRSSRRNGLVLTKSLFLRIIHNDIKFHPYVLIRRKKLKLGILQSIRQHIH